MSEEIILYGSPTCTAVPPVRGLLQRAGVAFKYVDIFRDQDGRQRVLEINDGYASVPTLVFADGTTLTEPSLAELKRKLNQLGYRSRVPTWLEVIQENLLIVFMSAAMFVFGILDGGNWVFLALGGVLLTATLLNGKLRG